MAERAVAEDAPAEPTRPRRTFGRPPVALLGPAFVAAIAYADPGNVAANLTAGARFGYLLVWVLVVSNGVAVVVQFLSAKLGLVTGRSLPEILGDRLGTGPRRAYWVQAELIAAATDLAEVIGGALALNLLFGIPLWWGGLIVGLVSLSLLAIQSRRGQRPFEMVVFGLLAVITIGFVAGLFVHGISWGGAVSGLVPRFEGTETVLLAASMLGATVMPHAIYLHSALARDRHGSDLTGPKLRRMIHATRWDVGLSLAIAGTVNIALLLVAAANLQGVGGTDTIEGAHAAIEGALGPGIALVFAIGLLASGLASTSVGCYAGATVMQGLLKIRVPLMTRRAVTLVPALIILASGASPTWALVLSQVFLSLGIPFALIPLVRLTGSRSLMGEHVNGRVLRAAAWTASGLIVALNVVLVVLALAGAG